MAPTAEFVTTSPAETEQVGEGLARELRPGDVVALSGELGAGKTCLVRGIARGLGVTQLVSSPTFVLVNQYAGRVPVFHVDAYRMATLGEALDVGFDEHVEGDGVALIEWADRLGPLLPGGMMHVRVEGLGDEPRRISIEIPEERI